MNMTFAKEQSFAERLRALRKEKGWTRKELAKKIGVDASTIKLWETEVCEPRMKALQRLAQIFQCSMEFISGNSS
jgi:transcriptional regulator with XRE-family HTH domain